MDLNSSRNWNEVIQKLISSTHLVLSGGSTMYEILFYIYIYRCYHSLKLFELYVSNIKVARATMSVDDITNNIIEAAASAVKHLGGWNNILNAFVKTPESVAVPIYTAAPLSVELARALRQEMNALRDADQKSAAPQRLSSNASELLADLGIEWSGDGSDSDDDENDNDSDDDDDEASTIAASLAKSGKTNNIKQSSSSNNNNNDDDDDDENGKDNDDDDDDDGDNDEDDDAVINRVRKPRDESSKPTKATTIHSIDRLKAKAAKAAAVSTATTTTTNSQPTSVQTKSSTSTSTKNNTTKKPAITTTTTTTTKKPSTTLSAINNASKKRPANSNVAAQTKKAKK
jgi:hypothetical protein